MSDRITYRLVHSEARRRAIAAINAAPDGYVATLTPPKRSTDQNAKMWAMLTDVSRAKPVIDGRQRVHTRDVWKAIMMNGCGHAVQFETGVDGAPFPIGFSSSNLTKAQMSELIDYIAWFGNEYGVKWSEPEFAERNEINSGSISSRVA